MPHLENIVVIAGISVSSISALLLIFFNRGRKAEQYMLAAILLILSWYAFFHPLRVYGLLASYPFILRAGVPFYYLIPPFIYWYTKRKLNAGPIKDKYLFAHLALFFLGALDISWYYIRDYDRLRDIAVSVSQNFDNLFVMAGGFLPVVTHYILRPVQGSLYCIASCYLVYAAYEKGMLKKMPAAMRAWIILFNAALAVIYLMLFQITIINPPEEFPLAGYYVGFWPAIIMMMLFCMLGASLLFIPLVFKGDKNKQDPPKAPATNPDVVTPSNTDESPLPEIKPINRTQTDGRLTTPSEFGVGYADDVKKAI